MPASGEYYLEIRDVRYGGNADWQYCIEASDRPFVTNVHPMRVTPGVATKLELVGYNLPADPTATLTLPPNTPEGLHWVVLDLPGGQKSNAVPVIVSRLPAVAEAAGDNNTPAKAQPVPVPCGISGRIEAEGDVDCYSFEAKAGEQFAFEVVARGHQSAIDPVIAHPQREGRPRSPRTTTSATGSSTPTRGSSSGRPRPHGKYVVEIRDAHGRGGPEFVYFLKVTRAEPDFTLELDTDKTPLAPGTSSAIFVRVTRHNGFAGEVQLAIDGLPTGVTATCGRILPSGKDGCILLTAAPDAKLGAAEIRVTGTATHAPLVALAPTQAHGRRPAAAGDLHARRRAAITGRSTCTSFRSATRSTFGPVKLSTTDVVLKPGESKRMDVTVERAAGFKGNLTLDVVYQHLGSVYGDSLPPGVTIDDKASQTVLTGDQVKGHLTLKAAADAKPVGASSSCRSWPTCRSTS